MPTSAPMTEDARIDRVHRVGTLSRHPTACNARLLLTRKLPDLRWFIGTVDLDLKLPGLEELQDIGKMLIRLARLFDH